MNRFIEFDEKHAPETGTTIVSLTNWKKSLPDSVFEENVAIWEYVPGQLKTITHYMILREPGRI